MSSIQILYEFPVKTKEARDKGHSRAMVLISGLLTFNADPVGCLKRSWGCVGDIPEMVGLASILYTCFSILAFRVELSGRLAYCSGDTLRLR